MIAPIPGTLRLTFPPKSRIMLWRNLQNHRQKQRGRLSNSSQEKERNLRHTPLGYDIVAEICKELSSQHYNWRIDSSEPDLSEATTKSAERQKARNEAIN